MHQRSSGNNKKAISDNNGNEVTHVSCYKLNQAAASSDKVWLSIDLQTEYFVHAVVLMSDHYTGN